jgi:putative ABC transport system substrate-binding protein
MIGVLTPSWGPSVGTVGLRDGLVELGYRENEHFVIGVQFTEGDAEQLYSAALKLVGAGADILYTTGDNASLAAGRATDRIPIVFGAGSDPVKLGLVNSYARPGGNMTGFTDRTTELSGKRLQIFREMIPGLRRVKYIYAADSLPDQSLAKAYRAAARRMGIALVTRAVRSQAEARRALSGLKKQKVDGVISPWDVHFNIPGIIIEAAEKQRIPTMFSYRFFVEVGGLASYGPSLWTAGHLSARVMDKIFKGTNPAEIPVEVNTEIEFTINLKVAKALGLKLSPEVRYRADRLIR